MIKNVVFDMGNVLAEYRVREMLYPFSLSEEETDTFIREVFASAEWRAYDRGDGYKDTLLLPALERLSPKLRKVCSELCLGHFFERDNMPPVEGMYGIAQRLREKGFRLFLLSNAGFDMRNLIAQMRIFDLFDGIYISSEHHLLKPDVEIFNSFCAEYSLIPGECLFIDDMTENVNGAKTAGMNAIKFSALEDAPEELEKTIFSLILANSK